MRQWLALVAAAGLVAGCARGSPNNPLLGPGETPTPLPQPEYVGIGRYEDLAKVTQPQTFGGVPFFSFLEVHQAKETSLPSIDAAGFVYAYQGGQSISRVDGDRGTYLEQGKAMWIDAGDLQHVNVTSQEEVWYFVSFRPILQRGAKLPDPSYRLAYQTEDLRTPPADKKLVHTLGYITMDVGGRTSAHSHGGTEAFYVINGKVELKTNDGRKMQLGVGQGASVNPGVIMQLRVVGDRPVQILTYFVTPEGESWQTNVQTLP